MSENTFAMASYGKMLWEPGESPHTFNASSEAYDFLRERLTRVRRTVGGTEIRGTRKMPAARRREVAHRCTGPIHKFISPAELQTILPKALGAAVGGVFMPDESIPSFGVLIDRDSAIFGTPSNNIWQYRDAKIDKLILQGEWSPDPDKQLVECEIVLHAIEQTNVAWPSPEPAFGTTAAYEPYVFSDASCNVCGITAAAIQAFRFELLNGLKVKGTNSLLPYAIRPGQRIARLTIDAVWNDTYKAMYGYSASGAASQFKLTNSERGFYTQFDFGTLMFEEEETPHLTRGKGDEVEFPISFIAAYTTANTYDLKATNVAA